MCEDQEGAQKYMCPSHFKPTRSGREGDTKIHVILNEFWFSFIDQCLLALLWKNYAYTMIGLRDKQISRYTR